MILTDPNGLPWQIDESDAEIVASRKWRVNIIAGMPYLVHRQYDRATKRCQTVLLHRFLMQAPPGMYVDHCNGDTLDNRRENLRLCSKRQNQQNSRKRKTYAGKPTKNRLKGAHPTKQGRWIARIHAQGKYLYLGTFDTEDEAYRSYCRAADQYHGEFARHG